MVHGFVCAAEVAEASPLEVWKLQPVPAQAHLINQEYLYGHSVRVACLRFIGSSNFIFDSNSHSPRTPTQSTQLIVPLFESLIRLMTASDLARLNATMTILMNFQSLVAHPSNPRLRRFLGLQQAILAVSHRARTYPRVLMDPFLCGVNLGVVATSN
jgi:hypothetical protein